MPADRPTQGGPSRALSPWLEVRTGRHDGLLEVSVLGEIDLANHSELQRLLGSFGSWDASVSPQVDLDLSQLSFSDVRGLCHLLDFVERLEASGCQVRITGAQHAVARVLGVLTRLPDTA